MRLRSPFASIQSRVTALTSLFLLALLWGLAVYVTQFQQEDLKQILGSKQLTLASIIADQITERLEDRLQSLRAVAQRVPAGAMDHPAQIQAILADRPSFSILFNGGHFVTDVQGVAIASVPVSAGRVGLNYSDRDYVTGCLKGDPGIVGGVVQGKALKVPVVPISVPIVQDGTVVGCLVGITDLSKPNYLDRVPQSIIGNESEVLLTDVDHRRVIAASDRQRLLEVLPPAGKNALVDHFVGGAEGFGVGTNARGVEVLVATKRVPLAPWIVSVYSPTASVFGPVYRLQGQLFLLVTVAAFLAAGLNWLFLRRQLSPVFQTIQTITRMTDSGEAGSRLPVTTQDEIGQLVVSFNRLLQTRDEQTQERLRYEAISSTNQRLESLGLLAGGIAHDFNNLLASIFGNIELARVNCADERVITYLDRTVRSLDRATSLTRQLMTFSRGGSPVLEVGDLFSVVEETVRFALSGSAILCRFDREPQLASVRFDRQQIAQVFENLAINALQAMPGGGEVRVQATNGPSEDGSAWVLVLFSDNGPGIPPDVIEKIFEPFFTTKSGGHGLGLAMCHSIVARHHGSISVDSAPGRGTTFRVALPATSGPCPQTEPTDEVRHQGSGKVLIMDDDPMVSEMLGEMLQSMGYEPVRFTEGLAALGAFVSDQGGPKAIRAVFLDLTVPGAMGGLETLKAMRQAGDVPFFVVSGFSEDPVLADPGAFGFVGGLKKPFLLEDVQRLLAKYLGTAL